MKDVPLKADIDLVEFLVGGTRPPFSDPAGDFPTHRLVPLVLSVFLVLELPAFGLSILETCGTRLRRVDCALGQVGSGFSTCNPTAWQPTGSGGSGFTLTTRSGLVNPLSISEPRLTL